MFFATAAAALAFMWWLVRQPTAAEPKPDRPKARAERIDAQMAKPVPSRAWRIGEHELVLIEAPASNGVSVVRQQCFVWRDAQFRTASLSCSSVEADEPHRE